MGNTTGYASFSNMSSQAIIGGNWKTADELITKEFVLERPVANWQWETIGTITAKGSGNGDYVYTDIPQKQKQLFITVLIWLTKMG